MSLFPKCRGIPKQLEKGQPFLLANGTVSTTKQEFKVPKGKAWQILQCSGRPVDNATFSVNHVVKEVAKHYFVYKSAGTATVSGPDSSADEVNKPILVLEDDTVQFVFGASQTTGTSWIFLQVLEFDLKEIFKGGK